MNDDDYYDESFLRKLFLTGINTRDPKARRQALDVICSVVETWKDALDLDDEAEQASDLLTRYLPTIVRWKTACPFKDVRAKCKEIVESLEVRRLRNNEGNTLYFFLWTAGKGNQSATIATPGGVSFHSRKRSA